MFHPQFRKSKKGVPILSKKEIEDIAENYIKDFCPKVLEEPKAIDIDLFIEQYLGLTLDFQYLSNNGKYLGMTVFNDTSHIPVYIPEENCADYYSAQSGTIIIDSTLILDNQIGRYRYTCGHESGHWVFHRDYYYFDPYQITMFDDDIPYVQCREILINELKSNTGTWTDEKWMEWQADVFSSCILMPKKAVQKFIEVNDIMDKDIDVIIRRVKETFQVSYLAAQYRLKDLGIIRNNKKDDKQMSFELE